MKFKFLKKVTSIIISLMFVFSTVSVVAAKDIDFSKYIDYNANYTKTDIENLGVQIEPGSKYTVESLERHSAAYQYAMEVLDNPNATQEEINKAYIEYYEAILSLEICKLDEALIRLCYDYCVYLKDNYIDSFTEDSKSLIWECKLSSQLAILYTNTQEGIDKTTQEVVEKLNTLELVTENPDIVLWSELEKLDYYMNEYIAENSIDGVDYVYNEIPRFIDFNGYRLVTYFWMMASPMINVKRYDGYILESNMIYNPSSLGYILVNSTTGDVITIEEGVEKGIVDIEKIYKSSLDSAYNFNIHILGDADCDNSLSIKDATIIQKICAEMEEDTNTFFGGNFNDYNNDNIVNIVDATEIQKALVE